MIPITVGTGLLAIGFTAQWVIKKRLQDKALKQIYMWIAWLFAIGGGLSISINVGQQLGVTGLGASVVSAVGLLFLAADLKDKRPDWPAFFLAAILPMFMQLSSGPLGAVFHAILTPLKALAAYLGASIGG